MDNNCKILSSVKRVTDFYFGQNLRTRLYDIIYDPFLERHAKMNCVARVR
jgi:hypothetical protein